MNIQARSIDRPQRQVPTDGEYPSFHTAPVNRLIVSNNDNSWSAHIWQFAWNSALHSSPVIQLCCAVLHCSVLCYAVLFCVVLCCAMLCCSVLCYALLCCAMLRYTSAVMRCAMLCFARRNTLQHVNHGRCFSPGQL